MTPILKYPGAKWRIAEWIIQHMPPHASYLEPMLGSGAVFFNKQPSMIETINDIDDAIVNFFKVCREQPDELAAALEMTPWARKEYEHAEHRDTSDSDLERARKFAVNCWMAFGGRLEEKTGWRHSTGRTKNYGPNNAKLWKRLPEAVFIAANRLKDAHIECRPALDIIREYNGENVLIYADPPYVRSTCTYSGRMYRHEMTDAEHVELLQALRAHKGPVLLSGYDCELYRSLLPDWGIVSTNTQAELGSSRTELLWINERAEMQTKLEVF